MVKVDMGSSAPPGCWCVVPESLLGTCEQFYICVACILQQSKQKEGPLPVGLLWVLSIAGPSQESNKRPLGAKQGLVLVTRRPIVGTSLDGLEGPFALQHLDITSPAGLGPYSGCCSLQA